MTDIKVNGNGRECPDWCATDHAEFPDWSCNSGGPFISARKDSSASLRGSASLPSFSDDKPRVIAYGSSGCVQPVSRDEAKELAGLIEALADSTPARIRQFAAQIREASDLAFGAETEPEAGA